MTDRARLYGWGCSPFTVKARACFRYKQIDGREVIPNAWQLRFVIQQRVGRMVMPVLITADDRAIQDSSLIIDYLEQLAPQPAVIPSTPRQRLFCFLMEALADEWLPLPAMHYRWNFPEQNLRAVLNMFGSQFMPGLPRPIQRTAARPLAAKMRAYLPVLGIEERTIPGIEAWTQQFLSALDSHFSTFDFLLGGAPTLSDFSIYGFLQAHLKQDPYPSGLFSRLPALNAWLKRMEWPAQGGALLKDDLIPETLNPILQMFFDEVFPMLQSTENRVADWCRDHPDETHIKRGLGSHDFSVGGAAGERTCLAFSQWMLQRVLDCYQSMDAGGKASIDQWLEPFAGSRRLDSEVRYPLVIRDFRLCVG